MIPDGMEHLEIYGSPWTKFGGSSTTATLQFPEDGDSWNYRIGAAPWDSFALVFDYVWASNAILILDLSGNLDAFR